MDPAFDRRKNIGKEQVDLQNRKPLIDRLIFHAGNNPVSFHVPGHKSRFLYGRLEHEFLCKVMELDVTEIPGMDNLHCPEGIIKEAQGLAAEAYGVDSTYFLVNGSTCGILAALLAATKPGDKIIIDRYSHSSVQSGLILGRLKPVYASRPVDRLTGIPLSVDLNRIGEAIAENPDAVAVFVTNPGYYGVCSDIRAISKLAQLNNMLLIVDEAHGAHLKFCDGLPESAVDTEADIIVQSAHKTLPAMTQGSWLHVKGERVDRGRLERMLGIFQSTSPSYPIMASLDMARHVMVTGGEERLKMIVGKLRGTRMDINLLDKGLFCPGREYFTGKGAFDFDETKLVINTSRAGISGYELDLKLRESKNIYGELYDLVNWLGVVTVGSLPGDLDALVEACSIVETGGARVASLPDFDLEMPPGDLDPWEVLERDVVSVKLEEAENMVAASGITPYPPGIPIVCPGERITSGVIDRIELYLSFNMNIKGYRNGFVDVIRND